MKITPAIAARAAARRPRSLQEGTIISLTTLTHPLAAFGNRPRTIALIRLEDGSKSLASLTAPGVIGQTVRPRMRLSHITEDQLRMYDVSYEPLALQRVPEHAPFPGYILALTGPSGVGKSTVSRLLLHACAEYVQNVPILTTRARKPGDEGEYRYVSKEKFSQWLEDGEIVAVTKIPSQDEARWYGYRARDIEAIWKKGKVPLVITETHLLQGLANHYSRRSILSFGLLPPGRSKRTMLSCLLRRLRQRGRETEEQIAARLDVAEQDLQFFQNRKDLFDHLMVNDDLNKVIDFLKKKVPGLSA